MIFFEKISLTQFKNYTFSSFDFNERIVGICGLNGMGKTNLLDAVYYLCFTKSYFTKIDSQNTQFNMVGFRLEGMVKHQQAETDKTAEKIVSIFRGSGKKEFSLNEVPYSKFSEHIGKFPCVMIAPDDIELITGSSDERRKYLDTILCQIDAVYLQQLIVYNKVLQQRNSLLKRFAEQGKTDWPLLEVLDEQLMVPGKYIYLKRKDICIQLIPLVQQFYHEIADNTEKVALLYDSRLNDTDFESLLNRCREKDFILQRTNGGIHKDDLSILLNEQVFKNIASQGQRKSLLFALKLAEFELLKINKGFTPVLLLDDVFEKLDTLRMQNLLQRVCKENDGQVFITDTHKERLTDAFDSIKANYQIIEIK